MSLAAPDLKEREISPKTRFDDMPLGKGVSTKRVLGGGFKKMVIFTPIWGNDSVSTTRVDDWWSFFSPSNWKLGAMFDWDVYLRSLFVHLFFSGSYGDSLWSFSHFHKWHPGKARVVTSTWAILTCWMLKWGWNLIGTLFEKDDYITIANMQIYANLYMLAKHISFTPQKKMKIKYVLCRKLSIKQLSHASVLFTMTRKGWWRRYLGGWDERKIGGGVLCLRMFVNSYGNTMYIYIFVFIYIYI